MCFWIMLLLSVLYDDRIQFEFFFEQKVFHPKLASGLGIQNWTPQLQWAIFMVKLSWSFWMASWNVFQLSIKRLWTECKACPALAFFMASRILEKDSSIKPWRIVSYCDEVLPGNLFKVLNQRKILAWYWSFAEFSVNLRQEASCFHLSALRRTIVKQLKGGVSQVWAKAALLAMACNLTFFALHCLLW